MNGEIAGLEQQGVAVDLLHVEGGEQFQAGLPPRQIGGEKTPLGEQVDQKGRGAGFEPPRLELAFLEQQQQIEGVVDRLAGPTVAVVPCPDLRAVQALQFGGEHRVHIRLGVAANRRIARVHRDVAQVVQPGKQADLAEFGHPGQEGEANVSVRILDHRIQIAQPVADFAGHVRRSQVVQDRLVVFIHQDDHPFPGGGVSVDDQLVKTPGHVGRVGTGQPRRAVASQQG